VRRVVASVGVAVLLCAPACSLLLDYGGITGGNPDAQPGCDACADAPADGTSQDALDPDAAPKDASTEVATNDAGCNGAGGPIAIRHGGFCIDSTEVTSAEYKAFLDAVGQGFVPDKPAGCGGKQAFTPATSGGGCTGTSFDPTQHGSYPVSCVDWCDAWAFCAWAGKRLCGQVDGGPMPFDFSQVTSTIGEWFSACTNDGAYSFPWGNDSPSGTRCNTTCSDTGDGGTLPVATDPTCVSPADVADLGGNVREWVNSCAGVGSNDNCFTEGDSFETTNGSNCAECDQNKLGTRAAAATDIGIRCCSDLAP